MSFDGNYELTVNIGPYAVTCSAAETLDSDYFGFARKNLDNIEFSNNFVKRIL